MRRRLPLVIFALAVLVGLGALTRLERPAPPARAAPLAVASIAPIADLVREVAKDRWQVETLLPPGASPHTFEPTPAELMVMGDARVFFEVGLGLELFANRLVMAARGDGLEVVTVSRGITLIPLTPGDHHHDHDLEYNPHVWLDPVAAMTIVANIEGALTKLDPAGAEVYRQNAEVYTAKLSALDESYKRELGALGARRVVVFHDAYPYLARRYGIEIVGVIEESPGKEPSARHIASLVAKIREFGAAAVLVEPQLSPRMGEVLALVAGIKVGVIDPLGATPETGTYLELMRKNLVNLADALASPAP